MKSTVSSKGQVTIPAELRQALGLRNGTPVVFEWHAEGALLRKGTGAEHPVDRVYGLLRGAKDVDSILDDLRGPRPGRGARRRKRR